MRKGRKTRKRRSEEKVLGFSSASLFAARKREADHLTWRRTQGAGVVKGWHDNRDHGRIPDTFT